MDMDFLENLTIRIMLYTRVEIAERILINTKEDFEKIPLKDPQGIHNARMGLIASIDRYSDCLEDYNNYLSGRLPKSAAQRHFVNEIDATSKLIQTLKESM